MFKLTGNGVAGALRSASTAEGDSAIPKVLAVPQRMLAAYGRPAARFRIEQ